MIQVTAVACLLLAPVAAQADYTTINPPLASLNEASHEAIFEHAYGGDFSMYGGLHYTNGTVTAERIEDAFDHVYEAGTFDFLALATFAAYAQIFGYVPGDAGGVFESLFPVTDEHFDATGAATGVQIDVMFRVARNGPDGVKTSQDADNYAGVDHVATYQITGLPDQGNQPVYVVFFEDRSNQYGPSDFDYNDLVVQITRTNVVHTPEPAALGLLLAAAGTVLLRRRAA